MNNRTLGTNSVTEENLGLGAQALNKMAEMALSSQMEEAENLQVQVKIDPSNLAKGEVDSLALSGEGLMMRPGLRMEELEMQINSIAVKPLKAVFGKIELVKPAEGTARIVLTEADLNRAFNPEALSNQLYQGIVHLDGNLVAVDILQVACHLLSDGTIAIDTEVVLRESGASQQVSFTSTPINIDGQGVVLQNVQYSEGKKSPELTSALVEQASEILNLRNFEIEGISLQIEHIDIEAGKLTLQAKALVTQFPTS